MNITFHGAAQTVTGSKHLITLNSGIKILLDCGMFQGVGSQTDELNRQFGFDPGSIDYLILSHAHIDHSGLIPMLVKQGFKGTIYSTHATHDLCQIMLADSARIQMQDIKYINKRRTRQGRIHLKPLYTEDDAILALTLFKTLHYNRWVKVGTDFEFMFTNAGHILGAAAVNLKIREDGKIKRLFFSGDIGRPHDLILSAPSPFPQADYIITESTYGNKLHEDNANAQAHFIKIIKETCVIGKGKIIIPAFSVGRTQEVVYAIDRLITEKVIPEINVYVDSPLSVNATAIFKKHPEDFNEEIVKYMQVDADPFGFSKLHYISAVEESKALNDLQVPCIIISSSGMTEAGRIKHHIANNVGNPANTILMVGFLPSESLGGRLLSGAKKVRIFGEEFDVKARIESLGSFSAHADYEEMISYLSCQKKSRIKKIFLVHGEPDVQNTYRQHLLNAGFKNILIPAQGQSFEL